MNRDIPPSLAPSDRIAEGRGICSECRGYIQKGERFRWRGTPPSPVCNHCIERDVRQRTATTKERK